MVEKNTYSQSFLYILIIEIYLYYYFKWFSSFIDNKIDKNTLWNGPVLGNVQTIIN